ncbi:MAG: Ribosomal large subunit pseudouridine synthase D [Elusimicrobia bacterium]|nr:Ribosomal large subunit pseudouridine synthase D [Elusimicrobiota bacterium]
MRKKTTPAEDTIKIAVEHEGRVDRFLAALYPKWSRTNLQKLINKRFVTVDGHPVSPHHKLKCGQTVVVKWPSPPSKNVLISPANVVPLPFPILFEDEHMIVVNKPAGLVVHPSAGHLDGNTLVEILRPKFQGGPWPEESRAGLVHRLDRDTSGVIVLAKTPQAHARLSKQFANRQAKKTYLALVKGSMPVDEGTIESHLARHPGQRQRFAVSSIRGRWASTKFSVKERFGPLATLVELSPLTGRTHQIRVHLASYGHFILGDHVYGVKEKQFESIHRHLLHAARLIIRHPETDELLIFEASLPDDFQTAIKFIRSAI